MHNWDGGEEWVRFWIRECQTSKDIRDALRGVDETLEFGFGEATYYVKLFDGEILDPRRGACPTGFSVRLAGNVQAWSGIFLEGAGLRRALHEGKIVRQGSDIVFKRLTKAITLMIAAGMGRLEDFRLTMSESNWDPRVCPQTEGRYLPVRDCRLYVETVGSVGVDIVCVHSAGLNGLQYRRFVERVAGEGRRLIVPDLPGHGRSLRYGDPIRQASMYGAYLWEMLQLLKSRRPILVGCAFGADIVLDLATKHSRELGGVVVAAGAAKTPAFSLQVLELGREGVMNPSFGDQGFYGNLALCGRRASSSRRTEIAYLARLRDPDITSSDLIGFVTHDISETLGEIQVPVLLVRGEDDFLVRQEWLEETREKLPKAELVVLKGVGHFPPLETDDFAEVTLEFVKRWRPETVAEKVTGVTQA